MIKVTIDAGNGEVEEVECDGIVCGCVTRGEVPTSLCVDTHRSGLETYEEMRSVLGAMGAAVYVNMVEQAKGGER
nr:MAG TPA: hypothetical protein [Caudoviricetes sp.]